MLQDYFHKKIFRKNPRGQEKGVAWRHFCEINFRNKANKQEIHKNISPQNNWYTVESNKKYI